MEDYSKNTQIESCLDLLSYYKDNGINPDIGSRVIKLTIKNITFNYRLDEKCIENILADRGVTNILEKAKKKESKESNSTLLRVHIIFVHCYFPYDFELKNHPNFEYDLEFHECTFSKIDLSDSKIYSKIKIRACEIHSLEFRNTTFNDLLDFWNCDFNKRVIFYKTDFYQTTVFAACNFYENVLFTYSLIDKLVIFRQSSFTKGLDLSLSIGQGVINCFGLTLSDYVPLYIVKNDTTKKFELEFDDYVSNDGDIPIQNKRETFRILKHILISQNNIADSLAYKKLEYKTLKKELSLRGFRERRKEEEDKTFNKERRNSRIGKWFDLRMLELNNISNSYGTSYMKAILFILFTGIPLFYFASIFSRIFEFALCLKGNAFLLGFGYFIQFLNPVHSIDYLGSINDLSSLDFTLFHTFDFLGRLMVGYGIYQFIQAFRKYK